MKRGVALVGVVLAAGCAGPAADGSTGVKPRPAPSPVNLVADGYSGRFQVSAAVLENEHHGPQLCMAMMDSYPPQCGGPDVAGWKWSAVRHESANKTKWGSYLLVGKYDGKTFTLTQPAQLPDSQASTPDTGPDFTTPCQEPDGGWRPVDGDKATDAAFNAVVEKANADDDYGGLWIDEPAAAMDPTPHNDPQRMILNVTYTKDLARHETELRKIWGGALCVSLAKHSEAELRQIQDELSTEPGVISSGSDPTNSVVTLGVLVATQGRQQELNNRYGDGVVILQGQLKPLD